MGATPKVLASLALAPLVAGLGGAGCGDNLAAEIRVVADGATWMAVRPSPAAPWARFDGDDVRFDAHGVFDVAIVCREDIGGGYSIRATADDALFYDDGFCLKRGTVVPAFDITGRADMIFVGYSASYLPSINGAPIEPGTYDVVAIQLGAEVPRRPERVQVVRDVLVDGTTRIPIDIDQLGSPLAAVTITIGGEPPDYAYITSTTANGTWWSLGANLLALPPELARPSDRNIATIYRDAAWAEVPVHAGANEVSLPAESVDATFTHAAPASVTWRSTTAWERVTLTTMRWTAQVPDRPQWSVIAYPGAFAPGDAGTSWTVELPVPDVAGWQADWMTDLAVEHLVGARWQRARADGGRGGIDASERSQPSTSR